MIKRKGVIPILITIIGIIMYELIVVLVFNWTGTLRTICAAIFGGLCFSLGKMIEKSVINSDEQRINNTRFDYRMIILSILLILGTLFGIYSFISRKPTQSEINSEIPNHIINQKTDKHINLPNTKLCFIPPADFKFDETLLRFYKDDNTYFQVMEIPGTSFEEKELNRGLFENQGIKVLLWKDLKINDQKATFGVVQSSATMINIFCKLGDSSYTTMILGYCPINDTTSLRQMQNSILSVFYDKTINIDPLKNAKFEVSLEKTPFKLAQFGSNLYRYNKNGQEDLKNVFASIIHLMQYPSLGTGIEPLKKHANSMIDEYKNSGIMDINLTTQKEVKINGFDGYLIIGNGNFQSKNLSFYQVEIGNEKAMILFSGTSFEDIETDMKYFEKISNTLKIK